MAEKDANYTVASGYSDTLEQKQETIQLHLITSFVHQCAVLSQSANRRVIF